MKLSCCMTKLRLLCCFYLFFQDSKRKQIIIKVNMMCARSFSEVFYFFFLAIFSALTSFHATKIYAPKMICTTTIADMAEQMQLASDETANMPRCNMIIELVILVLKRLLVFVRVLKQRLLSNTQAFVKKQVDMGPSTMHTVNTSIVRNTSPTRRSASAFSSSTVVFILLILMLAFSILNLEKETTTITKR